MSGFDPFADFRMHDHVAIVTGGAQNIGAAIARSLAGAGAKVVIADLDADKAKTTAESIAEKTGASTFGLGCDVTSEADIQAGVDQTVVAFGGSDGDCHDGAARHSRRFRRRNRRAGRHRIRHP
ncbi:MAG TPA: SDR family oxidoreductase [Mycobacteriales bacterium]|nr:SDR family oxidoreductase [Mycobacteriales bacterium]